MLSTRNLFDKEVLPWLVWISELNLILAWVLFEKTYQTKGSVSNNFHTPRTSPKYSVGRRISDALFSVFGNVIKHDLSLFYLFHCGKHECSTVSITVSTSCYRVYILIQRWDLSASVTYQQWKLCIWCLVLRLGRRLETVPRTQLLTPTSDSLNWCSSTRIA